MRTDPDFWRDRQVLLTGHTGFKGGWAARWLADMGARVTGFALPPDSDPALFDLIDTGIRSILGDLRDRDAVAAAVDAARPQIVLHLAAQPLVRRSYREPVETFATNLLGTVHLLDALRDRPALEAVLVVTTDKVYRNDETGRAFAETDHLGGHDPYAASKAAVEIAAAGFAQSYFAPAGIPVATARGGNVIGGGDFAEDRLIPDIIRAARDGEALVLRNPAATRPWQHVLDCLDGYLTHVQALVGDPDAPRSLNIGPHDPADTMTVAEVTAAMHRALGLAGDWTQDAAVQPREMARLALDPGLAHRALGWRGRLRSADAIRMTAEWYAAWSGQADLTRTTRGQIAAFATEATP